MNNRRNIRTSSPAKKRPRFGVLVVFGAIACIGLIMLLLTTALSEPRGGNQARDRAKSAERRQQRVTIPIDKKAATVPEGAQSSVTLIEDDGQTLWASPTDGPPLNLAYVSPGAQIISAVRPQAILQNSEGQKVLNALGPLGMQAIALLEQMTNVPFDQMERVVIGWQATSSGNWQATLVVYADAHVVSDSIGQLANATENEHKGQKYQVVEDWAYYVPSRGDGKLLVVAPIGAMNDIIDLAGDPPPLRRDVERLLAHTDAERDVTIVVTPNSLFSEGRSMFEGEMTRLRQPLFWFLGDELSAAALSLDWGDNFFFELIATPTLDMSTERAASILMERVNEIPDKLEAYVVGLDPQPYGRLVVARFPAMVRKLSAYTRSGFDADHAVLRGYLPAVAGHNLLMGAELTLAEQPAGARPLPEATAPSGTPEVTPVSVRERLRRATSLRFARDTLEAALEQLSRDIGVAIIIRGPDLQADGITKNQSFAIDIQNRPAEEILVEILRLANPDKTATSPNDPRQKLVYVIAATGPDVTEQVIVTTRAAAAARGDELPPAFQLE